MDDVTARAVEAAPPATLLAVPACLLAVAVLALAGAASAETWSWFAEPFSVDVHMSHPDTGAMAGTIVVDAHAVRTEWRIAGTEQVTVAMPDGDSVRMWALLPDGSTQSFTLTGPDTHELLVHGYIAAVTEPEDPRHPCTRSPETHRCTFEADETVDGSVLERWRIEVDGRDGGAHGRWFWFDRGAGLVVKGLDDAGTELTYSGHRRGPVDQSAFEVP